MIAFRKLSKREEISEERRIAELFFLKGVNWQKKETGA